MKIDDRYLDEFLETKGLNRETSIENYTIRELLIICFEYVDYFKHREY